MSKHETARVRSEGRRLLEEVVFWKNKRREEKGEVRVKMIDEELIAVQEYHAKVMKELDLNPRTLKKLGL